MDAPTISIIVPVLNEAPLIRAFLGHLRAVVPAAEIIVVDGGSDDSTPQLCARLADCVLDSARGRARQMNSGASVAQGEVFWFLHADSVIPANALNEIARVLQDNSNAGGCFRLRLPGRKWIYRVSDSLGNIGVEIFGFALGDHGIFCRRDAFWRAGQFPDVPLMEDAEFYRALRRQGRMRQLRPAIIGSSRRYEELGPYRTTAYYVVILCLYLARARMSTLTTVYDKLTRGGCTTLPLSHSASVDGSDLGKGVSRSTTVPSGARQ